MPSSAVHTELWTSWASVLRSYAAAHGLNAPQHAVVEVSHDAITLRVGSRWLRFTHTAVHGSERADTPFALREDGTVTLGGGDPEEMDLAAERFAHDLLTPAPPSA